MFQLIAYELVNTRVQSLQICFLIHGMRHISIYVETAISAFLRLVGKRPGLG